MPYRGTLCAGYEVCPVRDCSAPVVPRQEEFSGAATGKEGEERGGEGKGREGGEGKGRNRGEERIGEGKRRRDDRAREGRLLFQTF